MTGHAWVTEELRYYTGIGPRVRFNWLPANHEILPSSLDLEQVPWAWTGDLNCKSCSTTDMRNGVRIVMIVIATE